MTPKQHARAVRRFIEARRAYSAASLAYRQALDGKRATQADVDRVVNGARRAFALQGYIQPPPVKGVCPMCWAEGPAGEWCPACSHAGLRIPLEEKGGAS